MIKIPGSGCTTILTLGYTYSINNNIIYYAVKRFSLRMSEKEHEIVKRYAAEYEMSMNDAIRDMIRKQEIALGQKPRGNGETESKK